GSKSSTCLRSCDSFIPCRRLSFAAAAGPDQTGSSSRSPACRSEDDPPKDETMTISWNHQTPSPMPSQRYADVFSRVSVPVENRRWPDARLTEAPLWVPVDLRDGNQALAEPMDPDRKRRFFELM